MRKLVRWSPTQLCRWAGNTFLVLAVTATVLGGLLLVAVWRDDAAIDDRLGKATAEVISVTFPRTVVRFATPSGATYIPELGVLYPQGLHTGDFVRVEYDTSNPDLVRVAGRGTRLAVLPVLLAVAGTWVFSGALAWWLRRKI